jgi:hypothetical protein
MDKFIHVLMSMGYEHHDAYVWANDMQSLNRDGLGIRD